MYNKNEGRNIVISAMLIAVGLVLPFLTGQIPEFGRMLLPMHIPVLLCGFICGWKFGLLTGLITPVLRSFLFGIPVLYPMALSMAFELAVYGAVTGYIYYSLNRSNKNGNGMVSGNPLFNIYAAMIPAMILGRIVWGAVHYLLLASSGKPFTLKMFMTMAVVNGIPGIILQVILIPVIVFALERAGIIRPRGRRDEI